MRLSSRLFSSVTGNYLRKIFISDVHGCYDELLQLLKYVQHKPESDELYFVGDLIAKGPKSEQVMDFLRTTPNCFSVMGNHDYCLLRAAHVMNKFSIANESDSELKEYIERQSIPSKSQSELVNELSVENIEYLSKMPFYIIAHPNIHVVHAGVVPGIDIYNQQPWALMFMRNVVQNKEKNILEASNVTDFGQAWINEWNGPQHIFFGHDARRNLQVGEYATGLDTGCCYGGYLTAAIVKIRKNGRFFEDEVDEEKEKWEHDSQVYHSKAGFIYRILHIKAHDSVVDRLATTEYEPQRFKTK